MSNGKWTLDSARAWLSKNKHSLGNKQVELSKDAGIKAFGCADYLRKAHGYSVIYPKRNKQA